jgi:carbon-monoxide dehydrogenase medium subunit
MNPTAFAYHRAASVDEAIALLTSQGSGAKLIAGGHSLLPIMKLRLAEPESLIDIGRLGELRGVRQDGTEIVVGALTTHSEIGRDSLVLSAAPLLAETASRIGDRQVRNRGTIGGALAHADAASDYPAAVLALEASIMAKGPNGARSIPAREFYLDFLTTALAPDEVLTEVRFPALAGNAGWSYQKLANQASGYAVVGVGAVVMLNRDGTCAAARIAVTGAAAVPWRAERAESALRDRRLGDSEIIAAAELADNGAEMLDDLHASAEYRRRVTRGLTRRAIEEATQRATSSR